MENIKKISTYKYSAYLNNLPQFDLQFKDINNKQLLLIAPKRVSRVFCRWK